MISIQLWSLRREIQEHGWNAVIDDLAQAGFVHVEPYAVAQTAPLLRAALMRTGITTPTAHGDLTGDSLGPTLEAAAQCGAELVMHPAFPEERWRSQAALEGIAADLRRAEEAARPLGMRVAFHHHDEEVRTLVQGRPALVALMDLVGPSTGVQFDPNWTTIAGADVIATMASLGSKLFAFHLKDGPLHGRNEDQVALGEGELDWPTFLAAAGSELPRVISLDMYAGDSLPAVVASRRWLERHDPPVLSTSKATQSPARGRS